MSYESCVLDDEGNCSRWNHDHPPVKLSNHDLPYRAVDFNDGTRIEIYDETHHFAAQQLRRAYGDEWEVMHRQALKISQISPLSYAEAVDRIIRRDQIGDLPVVPVVTFRNGHKTTMEAFAEFGEAWARLVSEVGTALKPFVDLAARHLEPPANVMDRALQARKNRNTGPARPSGASARRPRRHQ